MESYRKFLISYSQSSDWQVAVSLGLIILKYSNTFKYSNIFVNFLKYNIHSHIRGICLLRTIFIIIFVHQKKYLLHSAIKTSEKNRVEVTKREIDFFTNTYWPIIPKIKPFCKCRGFQGAPAISPKSPQHIFSSTVSCGLRRDGQSWEFLRILFPNFLLSPKKGK